MISVVQPAFESAVEEAMEELEEEIKNSKTSQIRTQKEIGKKSDVAT